MDDQKETIGGHNSKSRRRLLDRVVQLSIKLRRSARELADITDDLPCSLQDLEVLALLDSAQVSAAQLQRRLMLTSGALAHRLDKMETAGHIRRVRASPDRRQVQVEMTPQGVAELRRVVTERMHDDLADALLLVERRLRDD